MSGGRRTLRTLLSRVGGVAGALAVGQALVGLLYVVAARSLTPELLGRVATVVAVSTIAAQVFDGGLNGLLVRELAASRSPVPEARGVVRTKRRFVVVAALPGALAALLLSPSWTATVLLTVLGPAVWEAQTANALLRAEERFARAAGAQVTGRALGLAAVVVGVIVTDAADALAFALVLAFATEAVGGRLLGVRGPVVAAGLRGTLDWSRRALGYGLTSLAASAQQLDTPLVALGGGPVAAGLYAAAGRLLGPLGFLPTALGLVAAPWLSRVRDRETELRAEERRVLRLALVMSAVPLLVALVGPTLVPLVLGRDYAASGVVLAVLAVGTVFSTGNQVQAVTLQNRGLDRSVAVAVAVGLAVGLAATLVLAAVGGAPLAAAGFTVSQVLIAGHLAVLRRRHVGPSRDPGPDPRSDDRLEDAS